MQFLENLLHDKFSSVLDWHPSRLRCFLMILGVISSRSVQHHALAAHFVNDVQTSSNIRRIERFFKEQVIAFGSLARILLEMITLHYKLDLVMDRTN